MLPPRGISPQRLSPDDQPKRFTLPLLENELATMFGMRKSKHGVVEMLVGDLTGLGLGGMGAGESELAFNNSEFLK